LLVPPTNSKAKKSLFASGHSEEQARHLVSVIAENPRAPIIIVDDSFAQEYRRTGLPKVGILDRRKLMAQRLRRYFPASSRSTGFPLTAAKTLSGGSALFICVHGDGPVAEWVKRLEGLPNPQAGTIPAPLAGAEMLKRLLPEARQGWAILLLRQRTGGFRQITTLDGDLIMTRLIPPPPPDSLPGHGKTAESLRNEIAATLGYLPRLGLSMDDRVKLVTIAPEEIREVSGSFPVTVEAAFFMTPHEAARRLRLPFSPGPSDPACDLLFAAWIAGKGSQRAFLLPENRRRELRTELIRRAGHVAASAMWIAAAAWLLWHIYGIIRLAGDYETAAWQAADSRQKLAMERNSLAQETEHLGRLRQAVARKRLFSEPFASPWPVLDAVGQSLGNAARLSRLEWSADGEWQNGSGTTRIGLRITDSSLPYSTTEAGKRVVIVNIEKLAQNMRDSLPGHRVTVTRFPFLIKADDTLTNAAEKQGADTPPQAEIVIERERP